MQSSIALKYWSNLLKIKEQLNCLKFDIKIDQLLVNWLTIDILEDYKINVHNKHFILQFEVRKRQKNAYINTKMNFGFCSTVVYNS